MTFRARDGRQYVVVATGLREGASLQAFALPRADGASPAPPEAAGPASAATTSTGGS
jgi:hypothetical protein